MIQKTITRPELFKQASSNNHLMDFVASSIDFEKMEAVSPIFARLLLLEECQKLLNQREAEIQLLQHKDSPEFAFLLEELAEDKAMLTAEKTRFYAEDWVNFGT